MIIIAIFFFFLSFEIDDCSFFLISMKTEALIATFNKKNKNLSLDKTNKYS